MHSKECVTTKAKHYNSHGRVYWALKKLPAPRGSRTKNYHHSDIIELILNRDDLWKKNNFVSIAAFRWKKQCLKKFLNLDSGIPSHDTITRVLSLVDPIQFSKCLTEWSRKNSVENKVISIDGETNRGSQSEAIVLCEMYDTFLQKSVIKIRSTQQT